RKIYIVAVPELQLQGLALHSRAVTYPADLQRLAIALRYAGNHAPHEVAGRTPHHPGLLCLAGRFDPDLVVLELHLDLAREDHRELTQLALVSDLTTAKRHADAVWDIHGVLANSRHRSVSSEYAAKHFAADIGRPSLVVRHDTAWRRQNRNAETVVDSRQLRHLGIDSSARPRYAGDLMDHRVALVVLELDSQLDRTGFPVAMLVAADV